MEAATASTPMVPDEPAMPKVNWFQGDLVIMKRRLQYINNAVRAQNRPDAANKRPPRTKYTYDDLRNYRRTYKRAVWKAKNASYHVQKFCIPNKFS